LTVGWQPTAAELSLVNIVQLRRHPQQSVSPSRRSGDRDLHHQYVKSQFVRKGKQPPTAIIMHTLRKDGFMYLASRGNWASLTTKPLALFSPELRLNVLAPTASSSSK
jgi:hypothetical protein